MVHGHVVSRDPFIHSFQHLLRTYHVPGTIQVLGISFHEAYILGVKKGEINKGNK